MRNWFALLALLASSLAQAVIVPIGTTRMLGVIIWYSDTLSFSQSVVGFERQLLTDPDSVAKFWFENSYGATKIVGSVHPKVLRSLRPVSSGVCGSGMRQEVVDLLAAQGIDPAQYDYLAIMHPGNPSCRWNGTGGTVALYLNGAVSKQTMSHEIGHGLTLQHHANTVVAQSAQGTLGRCNMAEYGNKIDVMGNGRLMHSNAYHKAELGYLAGRSYEHTSGKATYSIAPIESQSGAVAVKVGSGPAYLWIEYRQPLGFDGMMLSPTSVDGLIYYGGALINLYGSVFTGSSNRMCWPCLVNTHAPYGAFPLKAGETYVDALTKASITVDSLTPQAMTVTVESSGVAPPTSTQESANGTTVPPADKIVDALGVTWTLDGGAIMRNGVGTPAGSCQWDRLSYVDRVVNARQAVCEKQWISSSWR